MTRRRRQGYSVRMWRARGRAELDERAPLCMIYSSTFEMSHSVSGPRSGSWLPNLKSSSQRFIATLRRWGYGRTLLHLSRFSQVRGGWRGCGWALRWVEVTPGDMKRFHHFEDFVHVDENWFYLYVEGQKLYLYDNEDLPIRKTPEHFLYHQPFPLHRP